MPRRRFSDFFIGRFAISSQTFSPFLLQTLKLGGCSGLTGLPESLGGLTGLQTLDLGGCEGLTGLPESLGGLTRLQTLYLRECSGLTGLPESLGGLTGLPRGGMSTVLEELSTVLGRTVLSTGLR